MAIPHICHGRTDGVRGQKKLSCSFKFLYMTHVEKAKISPHLDLFQIFHMTDVEKSEISFVVCTIYGILLHFALFC